jgi:hypothetical protein
MYSESVVVHVTDKGRRPWKRVYDLLLVDGSHHQVAFWDDRVQLRPGHLIGLTPKQVETFIDQQEKQAAQSVA